MCALRFLPCFRKSPKAFAEYNKYIHCSIPLNYLDHTDQTEKICVCILFGSFLNYLMTFFRLKNV